jgi:Fe-S cluster assembly protein SufD
MDDEQMFYLHTRGLPKEDAVRLIVNGFFQPIMERIPFEGVRERLQASIDANIAAL